MFIQKNDILLHRVETLGWYVRRYNDHNGQEVLELGREDITCWGDGRSLYR